MLTTLLVVKESFNSYLKYREIQIDNVVFRVHCALTAAMLLSASIILTTTQLIGSPIECISGPVPDKWQKAINTFCWVKSTFTMPEEPTNDRVEGWSRNTFLLDSEYRQYQQYQQHYRGAAYPGVKNEFDTKAPKKHYTYYQWVCFVLFFQALMCYIPKALWNVLESGLLTKLATGLHSYCPSVDREKKIDAIVNYLIRYRKSHTMYALMYWGCEALCFVNIIVQMFAMNSFLGGEFFKYGSSLLSRSETNQFERNDPMIKVFPRMTKCTFNYVGPSGSIVNLDNLCILPQNIINEKTYILLWFWFIALLVIFSILLLYRLALIFLPTFRPQILGMKTRMARSPELYSITRTLDLGDWWLFYMLAKNINPLIYKELINTFAKRDDGKQRLYPDYKYTTLKSMDPTSAKATPNLNRHDPVYQGTTAAYPNEKNGLYPTAPLPSPPVYPGTTYMDTKEPMYSDLNATHPLIHSIDTVDFAKPKQNDSDHLDSGKGTLEKRD